MCVGRRGWGWSCPSDCLGLTIIAMMRAFPWPRVASVGLPGLVHTAICLPQCPVLSDHTSSGCSSCFFLFLLKYFRFFRTGAYSQLWLVVFYGWLSFCVFVPSLSLLLSLRWVLFPYFLKLALPFYPVTCSFSPLCISVSSVSVAGI